MSRQQARFLNICITFRPDTARPAPRRVAPQPPLALLERQRYVVVELALEAAQVLVEDAERSDGDARPEEGRRGADVPALEDDAGVDDLGVPVCVQFSWDLQSAGR